MELLTIKLEGKMRDIQSVHVLVPLSHLSINRNPNVCGLRRCYTVGYGDEEFLLEKRIFLDTWDINSSKD